jgi:hypothetical protein
MRFQAGIRAGVRLPLWLMFLSLAASSAAASSEAAPAFTKKPTAAADGDNVRIAFAVSRATDVAVQIEDAQGQVVRHLVAGVLGPRPPAPLKADSLAQSLIWDRRDDLGKPVDASAGPFAVRVSLGLRPTLDRFLACDPSHLDSVRGMACGPDGTLYVFDTFGQTHPRDGSTVCKVFSREGKYLRAILPYPTILPDEKLRGLKRLTLPDGSKIPFICQVETRSFLPGLGDLPCHRPIVSSDGRLGFVGIQEGPRPFAQPGQARLTVIGTDGSVPDQPLRTQISPLTDTGASLALSPDEKTIYAVGVRASIHANDPDHLFHCDVCDHGGETWRHSVPTGQVYRFGWHDRQVQVLNNRTPLKEPVSVATDKDGNVYVADAGDNRIVVFRPTAMPSGNEVVAGIKRDAGPEVIGEVKINSPLQVEVRKATGEIYVLAGTKDLELVKFDGYRNAKVLARMGLFHLKTVCPPTRLPTMALDQSADRSTLYLGVQSFWMSRVVRVSDLGDKFSQPAPLVPGMVTTQERPEGVGPMEISLDRRHNILYVNNFWRCRLDREVWEKMVLPTGLGNGDASNHPGFRSGAAGLDGNYYVNSAAAHAWITRLDVDLKMVPYQAPLPAGTINADQKRGRILGFLGDHSSGLTADAAGNVYVTWRTSRGRGDFTRTRKLYSYDKNGLLRQQGPLVDSSVPGIWSARVDPAGNIYLAAGLRPGKSLLPPGLAGRLPDSPHDPEAVNGVNGYPFIYGSIIKFPPTGGTIRAGTGGVPCNFGQGVPIEVKGAEWIVPGASPVSSWGTPRNAPGTYLTCECECPGLDVDGYGRSFYVDAARFRVGVLDTGGNEVCTFGTYGNQDSTGSAIAFCWPQTVAVGDGWAYVGDRLNRRIVRVKLTAAAEAACRVE